MDKHYLIELKADGVSHDIDYIGEPEHKDKLLESLNLFFEAKVVEETKEEFDAFTFTYVDNEGNPVDVNWHDRSA